jgi:hypothetical protein
MSISQFNAYLRSSSPGSEVYRGLCTLDTEALTIVDEWRAWHDT